MIGKIIPPKINDQLEHEKMVSTPILEKPSEKIYLKFRILCQRSWISRN
jgi:hypothetical protein